MGATGFGVGWAGGGSTFGVRSVVGPFGLGLNAGLRLVSTEPDDGGGGSTNSVGVRRVGGAAFGSTPGMRLVGMLPEDGGTGSAGTAGIAWVCANELIRGVPPCGT